MTFEIFSDKQNKYYDNENAENLRNKILLWDAKSNEIFNIEGIKYDKTYIFFLYQK